MYAIGLDVSPNHFGMVVLGASYTVLDWQYGHTVKKHIVKQHGRLLLKWEPSKYASKEQFRYTRNWHTAEQVNRALFDFDGTLPDDLPDDQCPYVNIEDYPFAHNSRALSSIYETTAMVKYGMHKNLSWRLTNPMTLKRYATGKTRAEKEDMIDVMPGVIPWADVSDDTRGDIADAYWLAHLLMTELLLRDGKMSLDTLSPHQRAVFLEVSKHQEVNLLARPFLTLFKYQEGED